MYKFEVEVPPMELRHRLRAAREFRGLEQAELAEIMGVARQTVGHAERGKFKTRRIVINAWATATGVPVEWLLTGRGTHQIKALAS